MAESLTAWLAGIGTLLALVAYAGYIYEIFAGTTRPHRISWTVWALIGLLGFSVTEASGGGWGAVVLLAFVVAQVVIFLISLTRKYGKDHYSNFDFFLGAVGLIMLISWKALHLPVEVAAATAVSADAIAAWPTLRGAWLKPRSEPAWSWAFGGAAAVISMLTLSEVNFGSMAYPAYLAIMQIGIAAIVVARRDRVKTKGGR